MPILQQVARRFSVFGADQFNELVVLTAVLAFPLANLTATGKIIEPLFEGDHNFF